MLTLFAFVTTNDSEQSISSSTREARIGEPVIAILVILPVILVIL
jgi:hypothetical protein